MKYLMILAFLLVLVSAIPGRVWAREYAGTAKTELVAYNGGGFADRDDYRWHRRHRRHHRRHHYRYHDYR